MLNINYFNESYATVNGFFGHDVSGVNHPLYGIKQSLATKEKIRKTKALNNSNKIGGKKGSITKQSKEWKETIGKEAIIKSNKTKALNNSNEIGGKKCSNTKQSKEWKETIGKEAKRKELKTKSTKEYKCKIKKIQDRINENHKKTVNTKEYKEKHSGVNHHYCKKYIFLDSKNNIIFKGNNNILNISKTYNISQNILRSSLKFNVPLFSRTQKYQLQKMKLNGTYNIYLKYKGAILKEIIC